uniref:Ribonuclease P protein subunit p38-like isoform X2 n=1 Tax=Crassostrea virginica TaxID=6565 RepID=A0A8B8EHA3_CRAVI|nr:ribonuclease P protein subunit p38-like isoform X2 [Crassostrea virginica]
MAAPMLSHSDLQGSLKNQIRAKQQKKKPKKMVLCSPYDTGRVDLPMEYQEQILQRLVMAIKPLGIAEEKKNKKRQKQRFRQQQKICKEEKQHWKNKSDHVTDSGNLGKDSSNSAGTVRMSGETGSVLSQRTTPPSDECKEGASSLSKARKKICFGINEVTKGLEKDQLRLVLVCQSCKPEMLTQHLIGLAASRNCTVSVISNLSLTLCPLLKLSSLMALGVKKCDESEETTLFEEAVNFILSVIPQKTVPWMERVSIKKEPITDLEIVRENREKPITSLETESKKKIEPITGLDTEREKKEDISLVKSSIEVKSKERESQHVRQTEKETDYSKFYVYKTITNNLKSFGADFIAFTTDSKEEKEEMITDLSGKRKMDVNKGGQAKFQKFRSPGYLPVLGNEQRVNNSKKRKRKIRNKNKNKS